jgi:DNA-binding FadR family transcriptional regulator
VLPAGIGPRRPAAAHRLHAAYDQHGQIADGILADDGDQALTVIRDLLARPGVALVHLRNVGYGCYNFAVRRDWNAAARW